MRNKQDYRIKKARFQKNYFNTLKIAAEMDELEENSVQTSYSKFKVFAQVFPVALVSSLITAVAQVNIQYLVGHFSGNPIVKELLSDRWELFFSKGYNPDSFFLPSSRDTSGLDRSEKIKGYATALGTLAATVAIGVGVKYLIGKYKSLVIKKERSGKNWVSFMKDLILNLKNTILSLTKKTIKNPSPEEVAYLKLIVNPNGSLDRKALINYAKKEVQRQL